MKQVSQNQVQTLRKGRNSELIRRMRDGEQLSSFNSYASWYPPRPIITKDEKAVKELYGKPPVTSGGQSKTDSGSHSQTQDGPLRLA